MANEALSKILNSEEQAKDIIENAKKTAKQASQAAISAEKDNLKKAERERIELYEKNTQRLHSEWNSKLNLARADASKEQENLLKKLETHKSEMIDIVVNYVSGRGGK